MKLEYTTLSVISQSQQEQYCMIKLVASTIVNLMEREARMVVARGCGKGKMWICCSMGTKFSYAR